MRLPKVSLTTKIFIGLILGVLLGWLKPDWGTAVRPLSLLFLNLIKSIIAPLIFSTLVIGIAGTIRPLGEALLAPFSRKRAVLYSYEVEHDRPSMRNEMRTVKDYSGFALTPSVIDSMRGAVKLLCYPQLEAVEKDVVISPDAVTNAKEYIANTQWTSMESFNPGQIYREVREMLTDDDGQIRKDWRMGELEDLEGTTLMEQVVAPGSQVFAIGKWSAEKRGLIPDHGVPARLVVGDARNVLKSLRGKVWGSLMGGIIFGVVVNAVLYGIVKYGRFGH